MSISGDTMKKCRGCLVAFPRKSYKQIRSKGRLYPAPTCRDCRNSAEREARRARGLKIRQPRTPEQVRMYKQEWARQHRDPAEQRERARRYYEKNRERILARLKQNRDASPMKRLSESISAQLRHALRRGWRFRRWPALLGYTVEELRQRLESTFQNGMSWDNYGRWHVDHIVPLSWFSFSSPVDPGFRSAWALTNLQALWARDNCSKGNRFAASILPEDA